MPPPNEDDPRNARELRYAFIFQMLPDMAGISRLSDGALLDVNAATCETLRLPREAIIGRTTLELECWADPDERQRLCEALRRDRQVVRLPVMAQRRGAAGREAVPGFLSARIAPVEGEDCVVFVFHDTTAENRSATELLTLNDLLQHAGQLARLGAWELVPGQGLVYWSDLCCEIHGLEPKAPLPASYIDTYVAPAWRAPLRKKLRDCMRQRAEWTIEMQVIHASGHLVWMRTRGAPVVENGRVARIRGVIQDIDESRRAEKQLRQSEERFSRIFQLIDQPLGLSHCRDGRYLMVNPAWEAMMGISSQQAVGRTAVEMGILHRDTRATLIAACEANGGALTNYELTLTAAHGRQLTALQSMRRVEMDGEPCWLFTAHDISERKRDEERLQRMALTDALTGLPNRMELAQRLQAAMHDARATGTQLGVAYLDLDGFKPVNDRLGHEAGDRLLVAVAARLTGALRPRDCVARLGGDEFVILLPSLTVREDCEHLLRQVMASISAPYLQGDERATLTTSIGYTLYPEDDADADTLLRHADQAMYQAKEDGRNRFHGFDAQLDRSERERREQGQRIRAGLANGEFTLYLQPKVDLRTGAVVGAEALARWNHPERGVLAPGAFLPALKGTELETSFGQWVFEEALRSIEALQRQGLHLPLSINVAAQHIQQPGFARWVIDCLMRHPGVATEQVELEITESAALYDVAHVAHELAQLRGLGVSVALDDFGTGYSSLTYLRRLPMDKIKIDQSFVHGMMRDAGDRAIVQSVIGLAHSFNYHVIAEGVETLEQGWMLQQMGCPLAQGYCIARPMPLADFAPWVAQWRLPAAWLPTDWQARHSSDPGSGGYAGA
ncbi:MAG: EAL domain-containing protein [Acidovorax sp.]